MIRFHGSIACARDVLFAGELVKHLEELAHAMRKAVELECSAGEATLAASAATVASDLAQRQSHAACKDVESLTRRRDAISDALKAQDYNRNTQGTLATQDTITDTVVDGRTSYAIEVRSLTHVERISK